MEGGNPNEAGQPASLYILYYIMYGEVLITSFRRKVYYSITHANECVTSGTSLYE